MSDETSLRSHDSLGFGRWSWRVFCTGTLAYVLLRILLLLDGQGSMLGTFDASLVLLTIVALLSTAVCAPHLVGRIVSADAGARSNIFVDALRVALLAGAMWLLAKAIVA